VARTNSASSKEGVGRGGLVKEKDADDLAFVDLDKCRDPVTGEIGAWAWEIIRKFNTYTEISPNLTGVHLYLRGHLPKNYKTATIEAYDSVRFTTLTGLRVDGTPDDIQPAQEALDWLVARLEKDVPEALNGRYADTRDLWTIKHGVVPLSDDELLNRIRRSKQGEKFTTLYDAGDWSTYDSQSEGVMALVVTLAWWTRHHTERVDRLFRASALYSGKWLHKWDDPRGDVTLGECEMAAAFALLGTDMYTPPASEQAKTEGAEMTTVRASDVVEQPLFWLWPRYIPFGKATALDGEPDKGKSQVLLDVAARVTQGAAMPDGERQNVGCRWAGRSVGAVPVRRDAQARPGALSCATTARRSGPLISCRSPTCASGRSPPSSWSTSPHAGWCTWALHATRLTPGSHSSCARRRPSAGIRSTSSSFPAEDPYL
jgi:hypothetical protein